MKPWERDWSQPAEQPKPWERQWAKSNEAPVKAEPESYDSTGTTGERFWAGMGYGMSSAYQNAADKGLGILERHPIAQDMKRLGLDPVGYIRQRLQTHLDEQKKLAEPLLNTTAGKVGRVAGGLAVAAPTIFVPGVNTYAGASLVGGATGGLTSEQRDAKGIATDTALGAAGGAAGKAVGDTAGKGFRILRDKATQYAAQRAAATQPMREAVENARTLGYTVQPTLANPTTLNARLEGFAGKAAVQQKASLKNQEVTNRLAKKALGLAEDDPLNAQVLAEMREQAGQAYGELAKQGKFTADAAYQLDLAKMRKPLESFAEDFPDLANNEVSRLVSALSKGEFNSTSTVEALKRFRFEGFANAKNPDPIKRELGRVQLQAADALEGLVERNLQKGGQSQLLQQFKDARKTIAKVYTVEDVLNSTTGNIDARQLAKLLDKGRPLSGDLRKVAEFAQAFPKAAEVQKSSVLGSSPLDLAVGATAATSVGPAGFLATMFRPTVQNLLLSPQYQSRMVMPRAPSPALQELLSNATNSEMFRRTAPVMGSLAGSELGKK